MKHNDLITDYIDQKSKGKSYSEIRSELKSKGISKEEISEIIKEIDDTILKGQHIKSKKKYGQVLYILGVTLIVYGIARELFSVYNYLNNETPIAIVILPFLFGVTLVHIGRNRKRDLNRVKGVRRF
jgi:hypothetical protein